MWEFEIVCDLENQDLLKYIQKNLGEVIRKNDGVMALITNGDSLFLSIGAKQEKTPEIKAHLRLLICDVICEKMKQRFMENNLILPQNQSNLFNTFVKVCTYFDRELERQIVLRALDLKDKKINLKSFLFFKLHNLLNKWQELCDLTNQNIITILKKDNFVELLKFLLQSIDSKCQSVILELHDKCLIYHDTQNDFDIITSIDINDNFGVLAKLIELNPYLIKIHTDESNFEIINLVRSVFEDRVELG